jgi:hypothetical protein
MNQLMLKRDEPVIVTINGTKFMLDRWSHFVDAGNPIASIERLTVEFIRIADSEHRTCMCPSCITAPEEVI